MPTGNTLKALLLSLFTLAASGAGFAVYQFAFTAGDTKTYIFKAYNGNTLTSGFACNCIKNRGWNGGANSISCGAKVIPIKDFNGNQIATPSDTDACCLDKPKYKTNDLTKKDSRHCFQ